MTLREGEEIGYARKLYKEMDEEKRQQQKTTLTHAYKRTRGFRTRKDGKMYERDRLCTRYASGS